MAGSLRKAYEITDAKIQFVSLVDKAANKRQFLLKKEDGGKATFTTYGRIIKTDAENHYVTGVVYEPMEEDSHGNFMTEEEITKAAYWFAKNGDKVDLQHSFEPLDGATVVENWIAKADFDIDGEKIRKGTWLMTVEVTDADVWDGIEKGDITGFSMGGLGNYSEEDVDLDSVSKQQETSAKKGLLKQIAEALGVSVVEKGAMAELYEERSKSTLFWNAFNSLEEVLYSYDSVTGRWRYEADEGRVRECLEEFSAIITSILTGKESITKAIQADRPEPVAKAGKKMSGKNKETLTGIYESLGTFLKEFDDPEPEADPDDDENKGGEKAEEPDGDGNTKTDKDKEDKEVTKQEVETIVASAIAKAMGGSGQQQEQPAQGAQSGAGAVEKEAATGNITPEAITPESIEKMVQEAITKAMTPQAEHISAEQVQEMITAAVAKAVDPVLKSRGLPSNLGGDGTVEKRAGEQHYLHGIL